jgi:hypothetical protein
MKNYRKKCIRPIHNLKIPPLSFIFPTFDEDTTNNTVNYATILKVI